MDLAGSIIISGNVEVNLLDYVVVACSAGVEWTSSIDFWAALPFPMSISLSFFMFVSPNSSFRYPLSILETNMGQEDPSMSVWKSHSAEKSRGNGHACKKFWEQ